VLVWAACGTAVKILLEYIDCFWCGCLALDILTQVDGLFYVFYVSVGFVFVVL
jgi:hypothetical protein